MPKSKTNFTQRLLKLISEPQFVKLENILNEPNFFRIVGRAHYERWHSAFYGWLLDPCGSHLLSDYALKCFLILLLDDKCLKSNRNHEEFLLKVLPTIELSEIEVSPNESSPIETSVANVGRFDIFLSAKYESYFEHSGRLNIIFELKIDSKPNFEQSQRYATWLFNTYPDDINFLIYLTPSLFNNSRETVGDARWNCLNYQIVNDKLLIPLLDHPNLNDKVKPFIIQYIKNLKIPHRGVKMAITDEEKRIAIALYEKYSDVFDSIYDALVEVGTVDYSTSDINSSKGRITSGRLAIKIEQKVLSNDTVCLLFQDVLNYLVQQNLLQKLPLPWGTSKKRYIVTNHNPPKHPNGRNFFYPVTCKGYTMESHYSRDRSIKVLSTLCRKLEVEFEVIDT